MIFNPAFDTFGKNTWALGVSVSPELHLFTTGTPHVAVNHSDRSTLFMLHSVQYNSNEADSAFQMKEHVQDGHTHAQRVNVKLQACLADTAEVSEYRFLVNDKDIKYILVEPGVIPPDDISFEPVLKSLLPQFPAGDWNEGLVAKHPHTGDAYFKSIEHRDFQGVKNVWHSTQVDHIQLKWISRLRQNIQRVTCPLFEEPVVYKFAEFPWQTPWLESETTAYSWLCDQGIGPKFLGHVTEAGRVIGFLMEAVEGRTADVEDLDKCQRALKRLHALGIKHGDINKHNFLIQEGQEEAILLDFDTSRRCQDEQELMNEYDDLQRQLEENTGRGGDGVTMP